MRFFAYSLLLTAVMFAVGARAEAASYSESANKIGSCFESKDWSCAFEGLVQLYGSDQAVSICASGYHGCSSQILGVYISGIAVATTSDAAERRDIAERALNVLGPLSEGQIVEIGEPYFAALRYDACKTLKDAACVAESADLLRLAFANADDYAAPDEFLGEIQDQYGVLYPVDLALVAAEIDQTEQKK